MRGEVEQIIIERQGKAELVSSEKSERAVVLSRLQDWQTGENLVVYLQHTISFLAKLSKLPSRCAEDHFREHFLEKLELRETKNFFGL